MKAQLSALHGDMQRLETCRLTSSCMKRSPQNDPIKVLSPVIGASFPRLGWETHCALKQRPGLEKQEINEPDIHITKVLPSDSQSSQRTTVGLTKLISWMFQAGTTSSLLTACILHTPREEEIKLHRPLMRVKDNVLLLNAGCSDF